MKIKEAWNLIDNMKSRYGEKFTYKEMKELERLVMEFVTDVRTNRSIKRT